MGKRIKAARQEAHLSQTALARSAGVHWRMILAWENSQSLPTLLSILRIATALGVSPGYLAFSEGA